MDIWTHRSHRGSVDTRAVARSAASIQAQITALEAFVSSGDSAYLKVGSGNSQIESMSLVDATKLLNQLYQDLALLTDGASRFKTTRLTGLGSPGLGAGEHNP